ncbi:MAG: VCBS repeat-containing protein, partial [Oscillospiraceae bacterium]|nr:VCBS repeat-containing protein [Oscillospiraceae bacterium]
MKIKRIVALTLAVVMLMLCSGCSLNFFSVESLMSPPSQSGKNGEVEKNFKKLMSDKTVQLRTPASGDYQTAYILYDINGDGNEEAFVFYTDSSVDASVRMAFLECINGTWVISADVKGGGSSVYDVSFADLNNDGLFEVLVSWSLFESKTS